MVFLTTVGAFAMGVVPVDSHCWPSGEIFVDACLAARSGNMASLKKRDDILCFIREETLYSISSKEEADVLICLDLV